MVLIVLSLVSGLSFLVYGYGTLFRTRQRLEFDRYRMAHRRRFVGTMQTLGGAGVLVGLASATLAPLGAAAAAGLALMMAIAVGVRLALHDKLRLMVPAALFGLLNVALVVLFLNA